MQLAEQRRTADAFRTHFDIWTSERALHASGAVERAFARLREQGHVYESEGAVWLRTTDFGDDKDRVLVRSDGEPTYYAPDCAYYVDKRDRGFDTCIYLLGADHHGYVGRLKAIAACAGDDPDSRSRCRSASWSRSCAAASRSKLSKRSGDIVTLEDFVEHGRRRRRALLAVQLPIDCPLTLDIEVITRRTNENPVFYVQYADDPHRHRAAQRGRARASPSPTRDDLDLSLLAHPRETELLLALAELPAGRRDRRRAARAAPGRALPRGEGRHVRAALLRRVPGAAHGRRGGRADDRPRLCCGEATRTVLENGWACSA